MRCFSKITISLLVSLCLLSVGMGEICASALEYLDQDRALPSRQKLLVEEAPPPPVAFPNLVLHSKVDAEPYHVKKDNGKIVVWFCRRNYLGNYLIDIDAVKEVYEEQTEERWETDRIHKLSRLMVLPFYIKNDEKVFVGEAAEKRIQPWVKKEPPVEEANRTVKIEGKTYKYHTVYETWEVVDAPPIVTAQPREKWEEHIVPPPPASHPTSTRCCCNSCIVS